MTMLALPRCTFGAITAVAILAGCNGAAVQSASPGLTAAYTKAQRKTSSGMLLYVSRPTENAVSFYAYSPGSIGREEGTIGSGLDEPQGLCSDKHGNVWVANTNGEQVLEYAHGRTVVKKTLTTPKLYPAGCAVSPTGDLAVSSICSYSSCRGAGNVLIFHNATGNPQYYTCSSLYDYYFLAYDNQGDLYVDGLTSISNSRFAFCELPSGSGTMSPVSLNVAPLFPGSVQTQGKYVWIGDQDHRGHFVYKYKIAGSSATKVARIDLEKSRYGVGQFTIDGNYLIGPQAKGDAAVWNFPAGGNPVDRKKITGEPLGSAISK
ncbi:MAG TPA: hypothetical protein VFE16_14275 [Candidatus Cybelea sp.]|jgi:hypothetical protein|nr:hypothetical protein [Candidatus Cybelea sp.]